MKHILERETLVPASREEVFAFFSDAANLERLTPKSVGFHIVTPLPITMREGTLIDYTIRLRGFPMRWQSRICGWNPPGEFSDEQVRGPYGSWVHRHSFEETAEGQTRMFDHVTYALPFFPFGEIMHPVVRAELKGIFDYRQKAMREIFPG